MIPSLDADVNWEMAEGWWNFWVKGKLSFIEDSLVYKEICLDEI